MKMNILIMKLTVLLFCFNALFAQNTDDQITADDGVTSEEIQSN